MTCPNSSICGAFTYSAPQTLESRQNAPEGKETGNLRLSLRLWRRKPPFVRRDSVRVNSAGRGHKKTRIAVKQSGALVILMLPAFPHGFNCRFRHVVNTAKIRLAFDNLHAIPGILCHFRAIHESESMFSCFIMGVCCAAPSSL